MGVVKERDVSPILPHNVPMQFSLSEAWWAERELLLGVCATPMRKPLISATLRLWLLIMGRVTTLRLVCVWRM